MSTNNKTRIERTANGWVDLDYPNVTYTTRRVAREARAARLRREQTSPQYASTSDFKAAHVLHREAADAQRQAETPEVEADLTRLQQRLFTRLTTEQGVTEKDALTVIQAVGYNAAASYGHMRAAGTTHYEAAAVIYLASPRISLSYGTARGTGASHFDALKEAFLNDFLYS